MSRHSSFGSNEILAPRDAERLINLGLVNLPTPPNGSIQVHKRRLNRSSDEENKHIPLDVNVGSRPDAFATIPEMLISKATIEYVGFNSDKATEIWSGWVNWPSGPIIRETDPGGSYTLEVSFLDWMKRHTGNPFSDDVWEDDSSAWLACMEQHGIATELQHAIMDPHFKDIRLSGTCIGWVRDTIEMRYEGLEDIKRASAERERASGQQGQYHKSSSASGSGHASSGTRSFSGMQRDALPGVKIDSCSSTSAIAAQNAPGLTMLYKGVDQARINGLFDSQGALKRLAVLLSAPPTDFSRNKAMYYFSPNLNVAKRYAAWAKRREGVASVVIVQIAIPNSDIEAMNPPDLLRVFWPSSEWRDLIWHCRTAEKLPKELAKYGNANLIIGTIACKPNNYYHQRSNPQELTEACVLTIKDSDNVGKQTGVQYVFSSDYEAETFLEDRARNTIKLLSFGGQELEAWVEAQEEEIGV
ncbi:hypothetical protein H9Q72_007937 [Fusarium xylarioides]|uniref:Uncharacterized protein n=1 Tax=Fusarium xylarioides TaxID=221167 RepID=A0A9P7L4H8_9HYPO|nr:hypothetical protein H9Q70_013851 [Fusarium xylarioides]KAG5763957.1 hypothetical protein H9Q72_007937 [Fusarium xylarioides]KAG5769184.1 hypothetical protein H9Q73_013639 [Fusarium xylarioides]